jgi:hypothetical protein
MSMSLLSFIPVFDRAPKAPSRLCSLHSCRNKQNLRGSSNDRQGIKMGPRWYCSVDCFVQAVRAPLFALSTRRIIEILRTPRLSLGLVLLSKGQITADQLRKATAQSQLHNESVDETLIRLRYATDKQLAAARSAQWGYPVFSREHTDHPVQVEVPRFLLDTCSAAPLYYSPTAGRILLGFVYRVEHNLLESIEKMTGCRAEACFITQADRDRQMEHSATGEDYEEILVGDPIDSETMANALGRISLEITADEACITQCQNHIWARLTGKLGIRDLIFPVKRESVRRISTESEILEAALASQA